jgi:hypothetical protein
VTVDTASPVAAPHTPVAAPPPTGTGADGGRGLGPALAVASGAVALALGAWWWSHPTAFGPTGDLVNGTIESGELLYVGMSGAPEPYDQGFWLVGAEPNVVYSSDIGIAPTVLVCEKTGPAGVGVVTGSEIGSVCASLVPAADRHLQPTDELVLEVGADGNAGTVIVQGIDVTYSGGLQRGTENTGVTANVHILPSGDSR